MQTYASESQLLGPAGPSEPSRNARKSLQTCALAVQTFGQSDNIVMLWAGKGGFDGRIGVSLDGSPIALGPNSPTQADLDLD